MRLVDPSTMRHVIASYGLRREPRELERSILSLVVVDPMEKSEKALPGAVHEWRDGKLHRKEANGEWVEVAQHERLHGEELHHALQHIGDSLHATDDVKELNGVGMNKFDHGAWPAARNNVDRMQGILKKYKGQIGEERHTRMGLADPPKPGLSNGPRITPTLQSGGVSFDVSGPRMGKEAFDAYRAIQKKHGISWNGQAWGMSHARAAGLNHAALKEEMAGHGIHVNDMPELPKPAAGAAPSVSAPIKEQTIDDAVGSITGKRAHDTVAVRVDDDGRIAFFSTYSPRFNEIMSNTKGQISGIVETNSRDWSRSTFDINLAEEALGKLKEALPGFKFVVDPKLAEKRTKEGARQTELQKPIPEVQKLLAPGIKLFPYQNEGVRFLEKTDGNALIGDEMGLGKTLMSLAYVAAHGKKAVVVCPKVVRRTWLEEGKKFFPGHFNGQELRSKDLLKNGMPDLTGLNLVTVNYESLHKFAPALKAAGFDTVIVDESHRIKGEKTKQTKSVEDVAKGMKHRILLSGTAVKNKRDELFTQLRIVKPGLFSSKADIKSNTIGGTWHAMRDVYIARRKMDVLKDLPEKQTTITHLEVPGAPDAKGKIDIADISRLKADLAKAKAPATVDMVKEILDSSHSKVLVFTDSVEAAKDIASKLGDEAILHYGQQSDDAREAAKKEFQREGSSKRVFVSTRQSLAVGATLTAADKVVFNDLPWTAADVRQAEDRAHRVGQKNAVGVYWVTAANNRFDSLISDLVKTKYALSKKVNEGKQLSAEERKWMDKPVTMQEVLDRLNNKGEHKAPATETPTSGAASSSTPETVQPPLPIKPKRKPRQPKLVVQDQMSLFGDPSKTGAEDIKKSLDAFHGPKGGRWANPEHTQTWRAPKADSRQVDKDKLLEGNKGIDRADMPQIRAELLPEFLVELAQQGVDIANESVPVHELCATQNDLDEDRVQEAVDGGDPAHLKKPVIASADGFLLDGHHRWAALSTLDPGADIPVVRVALPIEELLARAHAFDGVDYAKAHDTALDDFAKAYAGMEAGMMRTPQYAHRTMSWRGNEQSPTKERNPQLPGVADEAGLTAAGKKKRKKLKKEAEAVARQSRMSPADRFAPAKHVRRPAKDAQHFTPDTLKDAREGARSGREAKRERIRADLVLRLERKPPVDPIRVARARDET